jgi:isopentenyldiphosphate isomerase
MKIRTILHEHVYTFHPMNGIADKIFHIVRCRATTRRDVFDWNEVRGYRWIAHDEIEQMLYTNEIKDGLTLVALLFLGR